MYPNRALDRETSQQRWHGGLDTATMSANETLDKRSGQFLRRDPNGSNRSITAMAIGDGDGAFFFIEHAGTANTIAIKDESGSTLVTLRPGEFGLLTLTDATADFHGKGDVWKAIKIKDLDLLKLLTTTRGIASAVALKVGGLHKVTLVAGTAVTNSVAATDTDTDSFVAGELYAGTVIDFEVQGIATATHSTDTLKARILLGAAVIVDTGALNVADNDIWHIRGKIIIRTDGASGTMVAEGVVSIGTEGTATAKPFKMASTAIDTTGALTLHHELTWSVADPGNSARGDVFVTRLEG